MLTMRWLARVGCPINRSTTSHPGARSHPRPAFGCRPKGDQSVPGCRLGVEGPKGGKIKEKVEETGQRQSQRMVDDHSLSTFGLRSHVKEVRS
jgi:hypothetical protein